MAQTSMSEPRPMSMAAKTSASQMRMNSSIGEFKAKGMTVQVLAR